MSWWNVRHISGSALAMLGMLAAVTSPGPWVAGVLANTMWAGSEEPRVNPQALHPLVSDNMAGGSLFSSRPVMTADGSLHGGDRWMGPVGGGIGRVFKDGDQPITPRGQLFNTVVRHAGAASRICRCSCGRRRPEPLPLPLSS